MAKVTVTGLGQSKRFSMQGMKLGALVATLCLVNTSLAEARHVSSACASAAEISAIQVAAVQRN